MDKSKKYMLFAFSEYYPCGGMNDLKGTFDTPKQACESLTSGIWDAIEIIDRETLEIVDAPVVHLLRVR